MPSTEMDLYFGYTVATLVAAGGLIGFLKAGSVPSLVAGSGSGLALAYGVSRTSKNYKDVWVVLAVSGMLLAMMGRKFAKSGKFMPPGLITFLSLAIFLRFGYRLL